MEGFLKLFRLGQSDLTVEVKVLLPEYKDLFTEKERRICRERLDKYGMMRALVTQGKDVAAEFLVSKGAKAIHADSVAVKNLGCFAGVSFLLGFVMIVLGMFAGGINLTPDGQKYPMMEWNMVIAIEGVGILLLAVAVFLWYRSSKLRSQCPSCKKFWAKELTKTTELGSRVEQREEDKVIGETRNSYPFHEWHIQ